jgi:glycerol kinase
MSSPLILAIDQGTSSTKCLLVDEMGGVVAQGQAGLGQSTPKPGWVEQDADEIVNSVRRAVAVTLTPETAARVVAVGLSTQRESCVIWHRRSGKPLTPVLSWQDLRTEAVCETLRARGYGEIVRRKSGLPLDPMFSAAKAKWLLDEIDPDRVRARAGELCIGTIDAFLLARLGGEPIAEAGNASRTQLVAVERAEFDDELLAIFDTPRAALPRIAASVGPFPSARGLAPLPDGVPIAAVMADSHAALFAHGAFAPGPVKATHGTGSSVMGLIDRRQLGEDTTLHPGLCLTIAWQIDAPILAFEGNIRAAGSTLIWTAGLLGVDVDEFARLAATLDDSQGVHLVPAFNGLGAPWWDGAATAALSGFTLGSGRAQVARAAFDSIAFQIADLVDAVRSSGSPVERLQVDGGPTRNDQLMQIEADIVGVPVIRTEAAELSALGVAHLAGLAAGLFSIDGLRKLDRGGAVFHPAISADLRRSKQRGWRKALARSRSGAGVADPG